MREQMIAEMLEIQESVNVAVNPDWREAGNPWYRAAMVESVELLEHWGWKWWKKQAKDIEQVQLELVDIWHFLLSAEIELGGSSKALCEILDPTEANPNEPELDMPALVDKFVGHLGSTHRFDLPTYFAMLRAADMTFEQLYLQYIGKSALNHLRQQNGYKEGTYLKVWDGREDNEHLFDIIRETKQEEVVPGLGEKILGQLNVMYQKQAA